MSDGPSHDEFAFGQLMATRLCHDLAGAVGAVSQGVELLAMDPSAVDVDTVGLVSSSADSVAIKLKVMRAAFGWSGSGALALSEVAGLMNAYLGAVHSGAAVPIDWPDNPMALQPIQDVFAGSAPSLVLNLLLLAYEVRPLTARLECTLSDDGAVLTMRNHPLPGRSDEVRAELADVVNRDDVELSPKTIQAAVTRRLAFAAGSLDLQTDGGYIDLILRAR